MNYFKIYIDLIEKRRNSKPIGYVEKHHIIPKSEGGLDADWNIVVLTAREHYIAHLLLAKIYDDYKMWHAVNLMSRLRTKITINSRLYEMVRINSARKHSEVMKGKPSWNKGKTGIYSDETITKISESTKVAMRDPILRRHLSDVKKGKPSWNKGMKLSDEQKQKISDALKGKKLSNETKEKISLKTKGEKNGMFGKSSWPTDIQKYEARRLKCSESQKCLKWWNNGIKTCKAKECPGSDWNRGRIKKKSSRN